MQNVTVKLAKLEREVEELRENQSRLYVDLPDGTTVLARVCRDTRDYAIVDVGAQ